MSGTYRRRRLWSLGLAAVVVITIVPAVDARPFGPARSRAERLAASAIAACGPGEAPGNGVPWFRLDPVLDGDGALAGQRLLAGTADADEPMELSLEPESFASGPTDGLVLAGSDDGRRSTIRIVDTARGCVTRTLTSGELIRRAVLDRAGSDLYEHRMDRRTRASLGVWRRPIDGPERSERVLEPLPLNDRIGLVFATELLWSDDGRTLAVLSCGETACVTRLVDAIDGGVRVVDDGGIVEVVGVAGDDLLVGYGPCHGLPCPIVVHDPGAGTTRTIVPAAGLARLVSGSGGAAVAYEDLHDGSISIVDLEGVQHQAVPDAGDLRLMPPGYAASADAELPPGWFALGPDGRPGGEGRSDWRLVDGDDGRAVPASEVVP